MEYYNSIYYTFSTIAQVLAGFIALSGVFILFKIQDLRKIQLIRAQQFYNYMSGSGLPESSFHGCPSIAADLKTLRLAESTSGMLEEINYILNDDNVKKIHQYKSLQNWKSNIEKIESVRTTVKVLTIISIILGVLTIIYSLIVLSLAPMISNSDSMIIKNIGITTATLSMIIMVCSIIMSFKETRVVKKKTK
jgi:hypothetical protein